MFLFVGNDDCACLDAVCLLIIAAAADRCDAAMSLWKNLGLTQKCQKSEHSLTHSFLEFSFVRLVIEINAMRIVIYSTTYCMMMMNGRSDNDI